MVLILLCGVGMGLGRLQSSARNQGGTDVVSSTVRTICSPLTSVFSSSMDWLSLQYAGMAGAADLSRENERLRQVSRAADLYTEQVHRYEAEIARLRSLIALPEVPGKVKVPASVIGYFPLESRATLARGAKDGIRKNMSVVTGDGLYGIVQNVEPNRAQVLLVSSAQLRIVGMVPRDPPPTGFVKGMSGGAMAFEVVDAKVLPQLGDLVVTSGFSERIPPGIPIGKIIQIEDDEAFGTRRCTVFPNVQVGSVREVFVLK